MGIDEMKTKPAPGVPDQSGNGAVENAAVFGARTTINF
jgi:hypothetical protein